MMVIVCLLPLFLLLSAETDLHAVIRAGILEEVHKQYVIYQLLKSLYFLHTAELIHRDVKPSNMLLNSDCHLKLCDFGLCRSVSEMAAGAGGSSPVLTDYVATRWYRGECSSARPTAIALFSFGPSVTPLFSRFTAAPEILLGSTKYTKAVDMWAIGCILGEMIVGKPIFPGNSTMNQLERVLELTGRPTAEDIASIKSPFAATMLESLSSVRHRSLREFFPGASDDALDLIKRTMYFNPEKRLTAYEALRHPYVAAFHNEADEPPCPYVLKIQVDDNTK
jgi:mitogen-activated protein kinase 15